MNAARTPLHPLHSRRACLLAALSCLAASPAARAATAAQTAAAALAALEQEAGGRLGVVVQRGDELLAAHRADERFPACSTFKALLAAAVLRRSLDTPGLLGRRVRYGQADLHTYAPVTARHLAEGMTVDELCAATVQYSDNVAANLLMREIGGPDAVTALARALGDPTFRLDRWEPELNSALPGDERDTCTPRGMAANLRQLLTTGRALPAAQRQLLRDWLVGNTTGAQRIRAGVPAGWTVGDKTGTGAWGTTNDIGVAWPPAGEPVFIALYYTQDRADAAPREDVLARATRLALAAHG